MNEVLKHPNHHQIGMSNAKAVELLFDNKFYPEATSLAFLSCENFLKSVVVQIEPSAKGLKRHDLLGLYQICTSQYGGSSLVRNFLEQLQPFHNAGRYPLTNTFVNDHMSFLKDLISNIKLVRVYTDAMRPSNLENENHPEDPFVL